MSKRDENVGKDLHNERGTIFNDKPLPAGVRLLPINVKPLPADVRVLPGIHKFRLGILHCPCWLCQDEIATKLKRSEHSIVHYTIQIIRTYLKNGSSQNIIVMPADFKRASRILDSRLKHSGVTMYF